MATESESPLILKGNEWERELENIAIQSIWAIDIVHEKDQIDTEKKLHPKTWSILEKILPLRTQKKPQQRR